MKDDKKTFIAGIKEIKKRTHSFYKEYSLRPHIHITRIRGMSV
jgi:hypothetical protein